MRLSLQVAAVATVFVIIVGVAVAYLLARQKFFGKEALDVLFLSLIHI